MTEPTMTEDLIGEVRNRFAHVESCPIAGPRIFFENAGGALTLKSVVETSTFFAAIPDNQGRDNATAHELVRIIAKAKSDMGDFFGASSGQFFVGESGTELLFRLIRTAVTAMPGRVLGSTVEHPATRSAARHWSGVLGREYQTVPHDDAAGLVRPEDYARAITPDTSVVTILHTSPVTGMAMDVAGIVREVRAVAPEAFVIVDGIQHACHGGIDIDAYDVDGYVVSPYKVFSRHGYGVAWVSDRFKALDHERLAGGPPESWEFGTRDTGAYATFSDVVGYFDWLGGEVSGETDRRSRILAAGRAIHAQEKALTDAALYGTGNQPGLSEMPGVNIVGGVENAAREGLVSFWTDSIPAEEIVSALNAEGVRTHTRKADHYSGNILDPLGQSSCVRVSFCHYNTVAEVSRFLSLMHGLLGPGDGA
ncbi:aminotransferase class V-fold PLP-dependent enzyme [Histidinibacterium aquaticum]|uniref:Aminotransferase class V-fold PLP-dependent enzyme n=1 Tax=Histidinibacterium aquaticum TaxID=2613962 RepID=A0A5J5GP50_9RHOB|nr:aminotransferase class V-fold PLP-dependent enzyme [Histidinibacterium aquaticum]KAA9009940.1 aminotransferase class V-fold PLP-dependent enzyme [Histidinibacterium aquaticum]